MTDVTLNSVAIAWQDNASDEDGFEIHRKGPADFDFVLHAAVAADVTVYDDDDPPLLQGEIYAYKVRAYNSRGTSGWSNEVVQQTGALPAAPSGLVVVGSGLWYDDEDEETLAWITIAWTDNADNETGFAV